MQSIGTSRTMDFGFETSSLGLSKIRFPNFLQPVSDPVVVCMPVSRQHVKCVKVREVMTPRTVEAHLPSLGRECAVGVRVQAGRDGQVGEHLSLLGELVEEFMIQQRDCKSFV